MPYHQEVPCRARRHARGSVLAEANQWQEDVQEYFGNGDECPRASISRDAADLYGDRPGGSLSDHGHHDADAGDVPLQIANGAVTGNHDELTLEMVTDGERDDLWSTYAKIARAHRCGIRRRLAPLEDNDSGKIELMNSLRCRYAARRII